MLAQHLCNIAAHRPALLLALAAHCPDWIALHQSGVAQGLTAGNVCAILASQEVSMLPIDDPQPLLDGSDPWWDLAAGVLLQAFKDAQSSSERTRLAARGWLTGQTGAGFCHLFNLDPEAVLAQLCYTTEDAPLRALGD